MPKIIGHTTYSFDEQSFDFTIIELRETVTIGSLDALENTHRYWVPAGKDLADPTTYIEPITNPDYNLDADYQLYRQQYNFLSPAAIKAARQYLDLSVPTTALLLDMPEEVFLAIENGDLLQSLEQEINLRFLQHPQQLLASIRPYQDLLTQRAARMHIDLDDVCQQLSQKIADND
ncbi:hypothetical protein [Levilactobacillus cerevisiae]|uniref:hypothetical protein n=1 Tax=Levilactobacillus cerevisiae TaxID=1704076 RepID=UPI000F782CFB|nr:hypothetical protein [Levilactobacillus cerevisiae]